MPFISIDGVAYEVVSCTEREPERIGRSVRTRNGNLRNTYRAEKMELNVVLYEISQAAYNVLYNDVALGALVPINGDAVENLAFNAEVTIESAPYVRQRGGGFKRAPTLTIKEA